jgi:hypothetical protein
LADPAKRQAPICLQAVPAQRDGIERLAAHRLHRITKESLDLADLDTHVFQRSTCAGRGAPENAGATARRNKAAIGSVRMAGEEY